MAAQRVVSEVPEALTPALRTEPPADWQKAWEDKVVAEIKTCWSTDVGETVGSACWRMTSRNGPLVTDLSRGASRECHANVTRDDGGCE